MLLKTSGLISYNHKQFSQIRYKIPVKIINRTNNIAIFVLILNNKKNLTKLLLQKMNFASNIFIMRFHK